MKYCTTWYYLTYKSNFRKSVVFSFVRLQTEKNVVSKVIEWHLLYITMLLDKCFQLILCQYKISIKVFVVEQVIGRRLHKHHAILFQFVFEWNNCGEMIGEAMNPLIFQSFISFLGRLSRNDGWRWCWNETTFIKSHHLLNCRMILFATLHHLCFLLLYSVLM